MSLLFGLRFDFRNPPLAGTTMADRYKAALEMATWADRLGCASIAISEHHGSPDGYLLEFIALANHCKTIKAEIVDYSRKFGKQELELLSGLFAGYGLDPDRWHAASILLALSATSRFLRIEESFGVDVGHAETLTVIEREIAALEGDRA